MSALLVATSKHKLSFKEKGVPPKEIGELITYDDSQLPISGALCIHDYVLFDDYQTKITSSRIIGIHRNSLEVRKCHEYLVSRSGKAALIYVDKYGTIGLLRPLAEEKKKRIMESYAFECFLVEKESSSTSTTNITAQQQHPQILLSSSPIVATAATQATNNTLVGEKRKFEMDEETDQMKAAEYYNNLIRDKETRSNSQIFHLRNLNGFVKSLLINTTASQLPLTTTTTSCKENGSGMSVLDLCCGHGGDINKWLNNASPGCKEYVGVDIAQSALTDFITSRLINHKKRNKVTKLIAADIGQDSLTQANCPTFTWQNNNSTWVSTIPLTIHDKFDIVSCQFALHYMFQSYERADHFFSQIQTHLHTHGVFIATTVDSRIFIDKIYHYLSKEISSTSSSNNNIDIIMQNDLQNKICRIKVDESIVNKILSIRTTTTDKKNSNNNGNSSYRNEDVYGLRYNFELFDQITSSAVDAPEWLVPLGQPLHDLAAKHNLRVKSITNFHDFILDALQTDKSNVTLMENMNVFDTEGKVPQGDWQVCRLYAVLILEKLPDINKIPSHNISTNTRENDAISQEVSRVKSPTHEYDKYRFFFPATPESQPTEDDDEDEIYNIGKGTNANNNISSSGGDVYMKSTSPVIEPQTPDFPPPADDDETAEDEQPAVTVAGTGTITGTGTMIGTGTGTDHCDWEPTSPESPPPDVEDNDQTVVETREQRMIVEDNDNDDDEDDEEMMRLSAMRLRAIELAGGLDAWDLLTEDQCDAYKLQAEREAEPQQRDGDSFVPTSPDYDPPSPISSHKIEDTSSHAEAAEAVVMKSSENEDVQPTSPDYGLSS